MMQKITSLIQFTLSVLLLTSLSACGQSTDTSDKSQSIYWEVGVADEVGVNGKVLTQIDLDIRNGDYGLIDRFFVLKNDKIIADYQYEQDYESVMRQYDTTNFQYNYDHVAWHPYYRNTDLHTMQSVTKSVTSILLGIAIDQGYLKDVEEPAMAFFSDYNPDLSDYRKGEMTISDLLTMQSGIEWDEENYNEADNSCILMELSDDWIGFVLDHPMDAEPGSSFEYNSGASVLLGKIVREATGKRIDKWAEENLFGPLGIEDYYWKVTPKGEIDTEGGLYLSTYSLAKIGYLMMHNGMWNSEQIVSESWVGRSVYPAVDFGSNNGYGYQWWVFQHENGSTRIFNGNGYGGQFLFVVPEHDLIVVFNGWNIHDRPEKSSYRALQDRILPAIKE